MKSLHVTSLCLESVEVVEPDLEKIVASVSSLDGESCSLLTLYGADGDHLCVGGGNGQYVLYVTYDDERFHSLLSGDDETLVQVVAGGQSGDYQRRQVVSLDTALKATRRYAMDGQLERSVSWQEQ